ncbi:MAG: ESPR domain-containing protein [Methylobacillus sp.]|nr:ESPR domain-containing protein [Methylobacillus sp.]
MNKNRFKQIFSKRLGALVAVGENAKSHCSGTHRRL